MRIILDYIFDWLPFGFGVPIFIGVGFALLADEFKAFWAARVCFYVATAWIYGKVLMWAYLTSDKFQVRGIVAFLVFGFVGVCLIEVLRLTTQREAKDTRVENPQPHDAAREMTADAPQKLPARGTTNTVEAKPQHHGTVDKATTAVKHADLLPQIAQDVGEIKKNIIPTQRHLSDEQRSRLISLLRSGGSFETAVRHSQGNMESQIYADEFAAALKEAGWIVNPRPKFLIQERDTTGVWIMVNDMAKAPSCALLLQQSLKVIGVEAPGLAVPGISPTPETACELFVGLKPN